MGTWNFLYYLGNTFISPKLFQNKVNKKKKHLSYIKLLLLFAFFNERATDKNSLCAMGN